MGEVEQDVFRAEYGARIARTRKAMEQAGIDVLIVTDPSNMAWLTGYDGWSFYMHQCVLLGGAGEPLWFGRAQDVNGAKRTVFMDEDHIIGYPEQYVQSTERHPMDYLSRVIEQRGWDRCFIGVEMDNCYFTAKCLESLRQHLPNARFVDATAVVNWQRAVKSAQELAHMRKAARIVERIFERVFELVRPGLPKNELVAEIYRIGIEGAPPDAGGDYPAIVPLLSSGPDTAAPHLTWNEQPMRAQEGAFIEVSGCYKRYHCPLSRSIFLGTPPHYIVETERVILEGLAAAIEAARPGNRCEDIARAFHDVLSRYGMSRSGRIGYSIGMAYPPDWGERTMSLRPGDTTVLQPNMTFHVMTGLWTDDWGLEITESIVITDTGAECLANVPRAMLVRK